MPFPSPDEKARVDDVAQTDQPAPAIAPPAKLPPARRRRFFRRIFVGSVIGGAVGLLLLVVLTALVIAQGLNTVVHPDGPQAATSVASLLFSLVCFGLPTILICAFLGGLVGVVRSLW
jgi:hypothetical protein